MRPILAIALSLAGPFFSLSAAELRPERNFGSNLYCETLDGAAIPVVEIIRISSKLAFTADPLNFQIIFSPSAASQIPKSVAKLEFASACLQIIGEPDDVCTSVQYLRYLGALNRDDIDELEAYYLSRRDYDPNALPMLKQVFSCY